MPRALIILAVVVVLLAVGTVGVVALRSSGDGRTEEPAASPPTAAKTPEPPPEEPAAAPTPDVETPKPAPTAEAPPTEPAEPAAPPADEPVDSKQRIKDFLATLSESEKNDLMNELSRERAAQWMAKMKYQLPADQKLMMLQWANNGANKLSDGQRARVDEFADAMKPRAEASLQELWAQQEQLTQQMGEAFRGGDKEAIQALQREMQDVQTQIADVKKDLDAEYKQMLRSVLTPEQMEFVEASGPAMLRSWGGQSLGGRGNNP